MDYATAITKAIRNFGYTDRIYYNKYTKTRSVKIYAPANIHETYRMAQAIRHALSEADLYDYEIKLRAAPRACWGARSRSAPLSLIVTIPLRK